MASNSDYKNAYIKVRIRNNNVSGTSLDFFVSDNGKKGWYAVDKGLFLDPAEQENNFTDERYDELKAVFLTHAHVDHCGQIPHLCKKGFTGDIFMSKQTAQISQSLINDEFFVLTQKGYVFDKEDELAYRRMINQTKIITNYQDIKLDSLSVKFLDNAHVLGANMVYLKTNKSRRNLKMLVTGDYRPTHPFISTHGIRKFIKRNKVDVLFLESTYGNREKSDLENDIDSMATKIVETIKRNGNVILSVFSFDRAQVMLYCLAKMQKRYNELEKVPIYFDGKLMQYITHIYRQNAYLFKENINNIFPENIINVVGKVQRNNIIDTKKGSIILATSGQMHNGSIVPYISKMIEDPNSTIISVGYLAHKIGKLIMSAQNGQEIMYAGQKKIVNCERMALSGFSAHADINELKEFVSLVKSYNPELRVVLYHGEKESKENLKRVLSEEILDSSKIYIPNSEQFVNINKYTLSGSQDFIINR